ncbi:MAG: hypothetical protein HZB80_11785 [Deltaproteobacteria bacterium]|nr:hypothetical protein [Deltaproteobacteria bacterium]
MTEQITKHIRYNIALGVFASLAVFCVLALNKYIDSLDDTINKLGTIKINLSEMSAESQKIDMVLSKIKSSFLPHDFYVKPADYQIFRAVDDLKSRFAGEDIAITNIEDKGDLLALPVNITGSVKSYTDFVNKVGYLSTLEFPFFSIASVSLFKREEKYGAVISYTISGIFRMPKNNS